MGRLDQVNGYFSLLKNCNKRLNYPKPIEAYECLCKAPRFSKKPSNRSVCIFPLSEVRPTSTYYTRID